jgi:uncharacterized membrane protein YphA (DoxX/SURF4 family)
MPEESVQWRLATRLAFRFVFSYLILYSFYTYDGMLTFLRFALTGKFPDGLLDAPLHRVVPWVARHLLHLPNDITVFSNGSGDTTYDWVLVLCEFVVALAAALVWSALDRKRLEYRRLHAWLRLIVRLELACEMLTYGFDKAFPRQFGDLTLSRQMVPFGSLTPFGLLWGFMAASKGYTIFSGLAEVLGGVLLLIPRLTGLGGLVSAAVLLNVFALNMFYDVPVKLFSFHLLAMAVFLAAPEFSRLANLLVFNRTALPRPDAPLSERSWIRRGAPILVSVLGAGVFCVMFLWGWKGYSRNAAAASEKPPYRGVWVVDDFTADGPAGHAIFTDKLRKEMHLQPGDERWKSLIFERSKQLVIQCGNDAMDGVALKLDPAGRTAALSDDDDPQWKGVLTFSQAGPQLLEIQGTVNGSTISAKLHRLDDSKFRLTSRGFHFINEHPY